MVFSFAEQLIAARRAAAARAGGFRLACRFFCLCWGLVAASGEVAAQDSAAEQEALTAEGVAGEIMDLAVEHCRRGESAQALPMLEAIRTQLDPPPALLRLIESLEATGCSSPAVASGQALRVQVGGGWDSNVSQGITARSLVLGSGDNLLELELDPSYQPRSSAFAHASVDYGVTLPAYGLNLQGAVAHRKNERASAFDVTTVSAAASREFALARGSLRGQVELSEVWLGGVHYQRSQSIAAQWLDTGPSGALLATLSATAGQYFTQPSQNSWQLEAGLFGEWRINGSQSLHAGASLLRDNATRTRPGGDREGFQLQAGGVMMAAGWRFKPHVSYTRWKSDEVFAPGLLDVHRNNRLTQIAFQAERPLSANTSLVLEWRARRAQDTVALYTYRAQVLSATLARRF